MKRSRSSFEESSISSNNEHKANNVPIKLLLHGADGVIPYMTPMLLQTHFQSPQPNLLLGIAVKDTCLTPIFPNDESSKPKAYEFVTSWEKDYYLKDYQHVLVPSFDLNQDAAERKGAVQATDKGVSVWTLQGRQVLSNQSFVALANNSDSTTASPVVSLYDCFEAPQATPSVQQRMQLKQHKREQQATERTETWLQELLQAGVEDVWAPVGYGIKFPEQNLTHDKISGFAIVGWEQLQNREKFLSELSSLSKTIAVLSANSFESVLQCIKYGVDVVGTNLVTQWSKEHKAFCLDLESRLPAREDCYIHDLADKIYEKDDSPLVKNCSCLACKYHSRAYIHHLVRAKELLAQILLMGHNLHHFLQFLKAATKARNDGKLESFVEGCSQ